MPHWYKKKGAKSGIFDGDRHNARVAVPLKKPDDAGYPKYSDVQPPMCPRLHHS